MTTKYTVTTDQIKEYSKLKRQQNSKFFRFLKKISCIHWEWKVVHPDPKYLLQKEGDKPIGPPGLLYIEEMIPVAVLKCIDCGKEKRMNIEKFENFIKWTIKC